MNIYFADLQKKATFIANSSRCYNSPLLFSVSSPHLCLFRTSTSIARPKTPCRPSLLTSEAAAVKLSLRKHPGLPLRAAATHCHTSALAPHWAAPPLSVSYVPVSVSQRASLHQTLWLSAACWTRCCSVHFLVNMCNAYTHSHTYTVEKKTTMKW